jgi:type I restriction enzyme M protein
MSLQNKIDRITDILRRDDGISGAMHYTEQISWILFLKYLDDYEIEKNNQAILKGTKYEFIIDQKHRWNLWACPKNSEGKIDLKRALTGDDLTKYVNNELFPFLKGFKDNLHDIKSVKYKIGAIFEYLDNRIASGHTMREVLDIVDTLNFQKRLELFELSHVYEKLLKDMGSTGGNAGEFYTPRPVIKAMIEAVSPHIGQKIYDGAAGSCGFLIEAYEFMRKPKNLSTNQLDKLENVTLYGNEKSPLAYVMGVMNMILHGIESPNLYKQNSLTINIRDIQEKDRYDIIFANPPFGGKEKQQIQQNFPVKSAATELLFLQHFMKNLKKNGKAAIIAPEGILFGSNSFNQVKQELLENFNLHTIVSMPAGVFLPYSGVKTNIVFFDRAGATEKIWYYEINLPEKLTKNKPIEYEHFAEFLKLYKSPAKRNKRSGNDWTVSVSEIKDYDLSAKNPNKKTDIEHLPPLELIDSIKENDKEISNLINEVENILRKSYAK